MENPLTNDFKDFARRYERAYCWYSFPEPMRRQCRFPSSPDYPSARDLLQIGSFKDISHARLSCSYAANWLKCEYCDKCQREDSGNNKKTTSSSHDGFHWIDFSSILQDFTEAE